MKRFAIAAFVLVALPFVVTSCDSAPVSEILAGKQCSPAGACASGYECDHARNVCVVKGTLTGAGGMGTTSASTTSTSGSTTGTGICMSITDCPAPKGPCETPVCLGGQCGTVAVVSGTVLPAADQTIGDCKLKICNGAGTIVEINDDTDVPQNASVCKVGKCNAGVPSNLPSPVGMTCNDSGGSVCSAAGQCVQCVAPSDCTSLPPNDECQTRTCSASGQCGQTFTMAGTPVAAQTKGDCKKAVCDGSGAIKTVADPTDLPNDGNDCTSDTCAGTTPTFTPLQSNAPCSAGVCDGTGHCVGCTTVANCSGSDTFCGQRTCTNGVCGFAYTTAGTALPAAQQTAGDCQKLTCNGTGGTMSVVDNTDVPPAGINVCALSTCANGAPQHPPAVLDTPCSNGGIVCDGAGNCVACNSPGECSSQGSVCQSANCTAHACGLTNFAAGTPAKNGAQTLHDCQIVLCDGNGNASAPTPNDNDLPVDGNPCTYDVCTNGVASNPPVPVGTACGTGGNCDGNGNCTATAANGTPCSVNGQCTSNACVDGVCCENACTGSCMACSNAKTGKPSGSCSFISQGQDPDLECSTSQVCNGAGACTFTCGESPTPPNALCPAQCTGGCSAGTCIISCNGNNQCASAMINCPAGFQCEVQCGGTGSCTGATVNCPDRYSCNVLCTGDCKNASIQCGTGTCALDCGMGGVCTGAHVACAGNSCSASCNGTTNFPAVTCGSSCACSTCQLANGVSCASNGQCQSGNCPPQDGVCCDLPCLGTCSACIASKTGGTTGTCAAVTAGTNPDSDCSGSSTCNGAGACTLLPNGAPCSSGSQCQSGICPTLDGLCCATACTGICQSCTGMYTGGANGTCANISSGLDPNNECGASATCDGNGACTLAPNGSSCTTGSQCASGNCPANVHVCCDQPCAGTCESCVMADTGVATGTCNFIQSGSDPYGQCPPSTTCNGLGACM